MGPRRRRGLTSYTRVRQVIRTGKERSEGYAGAPMRLWLKVLRLASIVIVGGGLATALIACDGGAATDPPGPTAATSGNSPRPGTPTSLGGQATAPIPATSTFTPPPTVPPPQKPAPTTAMEPRQTPAPTAPPTASGPTTAPRLRPTPVAQTPPPTEITPESDALTGQDASAAEIAGPQEELTLELDARAPLLTTKYPHEVDRLVTEATTEVTYFTRRNDASPLEILGTNAVIEYLEFLAGSANELGRDIPNNVFTRSIGAYDAEKWEYPLGDFDWGLYKRNLALIQEDSFRDEFIQYLQSEQPMVRHWTADELIPLLPLHVDVSYPSSTASTSEDLKLLMGQGAESITDVLRLHVLVFNEMNKSHGALAAYGTDIVRLTASLPGIVIHSERFNHKARHTQFGLPVTEELRRILGPRISDDIDVFSVQLGAHRSDW